MKADYEKAAKAKGKPLFSLTVADFFNAPVIDEVDLSGYSGAAGNLIVIRAHDDFKVTRLSVIVGDTNGADIEEETPLNSGRWVYTATSTVPQGTTVRIGMAISEHQPGATGLKKAEKIL